MPRNMLRNWLKNLGQKLLRSNTRRKPLKRRPDFRPELETLEVRLVPAISFNSNIYSQLQTAINAAESSGLANPTITITGSYVGGVTVGAFTNGTSGTLEITAGYGGTITAPSVANTQSSLISDTSAVSVELKGLVFDGTAASPNLTYGVYASGSGTSVNINNCTIQNIGNTSSQTGSVYGVYATGSAELTMASSTVTNIADETSSFEGVGVEITGSSSATLLSDTVTSYQADGIVVNGASSSAVISSCTVTGINNHADNQIGILMSSGGTGAIDSSSITANSYTGIVSQGSANVTNDVIENNNHGLVNDASLTAANDTINSNSCNVSGGGVANFGTLTLNNSTISGNSAASGGGIYNSGTATLSNNTISSNTASVSGGGIDNFSGPLTLSNNTNTGNTGGNYAPGAQPADVTPTVSIGATTYASLQAAINAASGANPVITITGPTVGDVTVPSGGFTGTLTIAGGPGGTITAPSGSHGGPTYLIEDTTGVSLALSGLTITGAGASSSLVYGVYAFGSGTSVAISNSTIEDIGNTSSETGSVYGGYVVDQASLTMTNSTVTNVGDETSSWGGIAVQIGDHTLSGASAVGFATLNNDTVNNYQADGIKVDGASIYNPASGPYIAYYTGTPSSATISNTVVTGVGANVNNAYGILVTNGATGTVEDSDVTGNYNTTGTPSLASFGIFFDNEAGNGATMAVQNSVLENNNGDIFLTHGAVPYPYYVTTVNVVGDTLNDALNPAGLANYFAGVGLGNFDDNACTVNLVNSYVAGNEQGVIEEGSPTILTGTTVCNNNITTGAAFLSGGGVAQYGSGGGPPTITLSDDLIYGNTANRGGGGLEVSYGFYNNLGVVVTNTQITNNTTNNDGGGGVLFWGGGALTLNNDIIANNTAPYGAGIANYGGAQSTGGGQYGQGTLTLSNSTVSGNTAMKSGGGIFNGGYGSSATNTEDGLLYLSNSTISGNTAGSSGGGIANGGTLTLTNVTIADNSAVNGGGIINSTNSEYPSAWSHSTFNASTGTATLINTIVAANTDASGPDIYNNGGSTTATYSLIGNTSGNGITSSGNNLVNVSAGLSALGYYGGPTQTFGLLPGSAAIGAGTTVGGITTDQRGFSRPASNPDMGAFQTPTITSSSAALPDSSTSMTINGSGFDTIAGNDSVTFTDGVTGTVSAATSTQLTVAISAPPTALGPLDAVVTVDGFSSGSAVQVASEVNGTWVVTDLNGNAGSGSMTDVTLPYAIAHSLGGDTVTFASSLSGHAITLNSTLTVGHNLTITGLGASSLAVSGNNAVQVFVISGGVTAGINSLTVENGSFGASGAGIANSGTLSLNNDVITGNTASGGSGGGIFNSGNLTVTGSTVSDNNQAGGSGGGLFNSVAGTLSISGSTISNNFGNFGGGGLTNSGQAMITGSTFSNNASPNTGGGVGTYQGTTTLSDCTLTGNTGPGAAVAITFGSLTLIDDTLTGNNAMGNVGGAVYANNNLGGGPVPTTVTLINDTIAGNSAGNQGGGVFSSGATIIVDNTIIAGNSAPAGNGEDISSTLGITANYSLITTTDGYSITSGGNNNTSPTFVGLSTLGNYGGTTLTMALLPGSQAIDAGSNSLDGGATADQRGQPRVVSGTVDMGAFECQGFTLGIVSGNNQTAPVSTAFSPLVVSVTADHAGDPVNGGQVTFTANPAAGGASATLATSPATIGGGQASVTPTANATAGSYTVSASASGDPGVSFNLTNAQTVTSSTASIPDSSTTITINGAGFSTTAASNSVSFNEGVVGTVTSATSTQLTVSISTPPTALGALTAVVTTNGHMAGSVQVGTEVNGTWVVTDLNGNAGSGSMTDVTLPYADVNSLGGDTVTFASSLSGHAITLNSTLTVGHNLTITGLGASSLAVSGNNAVQVFNISGGVTASIDSLTVENGSFSGSGGGIFNSGTLTVSNDTFTGDVCTVSGAGIFNASGGTLTVTASRFLNGFGASGGGGITNTGQASINSCFFSGDGSGGTGGGVGTYHGTTTLSNSTIANTHTGIGGAVALSGGSLTMTNDTITDNSAGSGGAVFTWTVFGTSNITLINDTITGNTAGNQGGGVFFSNNGVLTVDNTILAGNSAPAGNGEDIYAASGYTLIANNNLITTTDGYSITSGGSNNTSPTFVGLSTLGNFGGPTPTIALLPGSQAIGTGSNGLAPSTDERGEPRPGFGGTVDMGAFESQGFTIGVVSGNNQSAALSTAFGNPLVVSVTANNAGEPVNGGEVTFTVNPVGGAGAALAGSPATIGGGQASVTATANATGGSYTVGASASGASATSFTLTNNQTVTSSTANIPDSSTTITINGAGFSTTAANDSVAFNDGIVGTVSSATSTQLTVAITTPPTTLGALTAVVTINGNSASSVQVATETNGTWVVTDLNGNAGSGGMTDVTLPYAVARSLGGDTVTFASSLSGHAITLNSTLTVGHNLTITGLGASNIAVSGNNAVQVFNVSGGVTVSITSLTVENGNIGGSGGGIFSSGTLTVSNDTFSGNSASVSGGGIFNNGGSLTVTASRFTNNYGFAGGGGITNFSGPTSINGCFFTGNGTTYTGGGVGTYQGTTTLSNSTLTGNTGCGGAAALSGGSLNLTNDMITDNATSPGAGENGGGVFAWNIFGVGNITLNNDTITGNSAGNQGGGVFFSNTGMLTIDNTTLSGNSAAGGGGIYNTSGGTVTLSSDSISGNTAPSGSDIYNASGSKLIAGNTTAFISTTNINDSGTLDLNGNSNSMGALTGSGSVIDSGSPATLTVAGGGFFTGNITGANTALTVGGTSQTLTLAGNDTYGGSTTINGGDTLQAGSGTALSSSSNVSNAGTLDLGGYSNSVGALSGSGTVTNNLHTYQIDDGNLDPSVPGFNDTLGDETTPSQAEDNWNGNVFTAQAGGTQLQSVSFYAGPNGVTPGVSFTNPSPVTAALYTGAPGAGLTLVASSVYTTAAMNPAPDTWVTVPFASLQNIPAGQVFTAVVFIPNQPNTSGPWTLDNSGVSTGSYFDVDSPNGHVGTYNLASPNSPTLNGASWESTGDSDIVPGVTLLRVNQTTPAATLTVTGGGSYGGAIQDGSGTVALTVAGTSQTLTLSGTSTNSGQTTINSTDTLLVNGSETSGVSVSAGGTLGGIGTAGVLAVSGTVNPGSPVSSTGTLAASSANFASGGNFTAQITAGSNDLLNLGSGALTLGGSSTLTLDLNGLATASGSPITIISDGSQSGHFNSVNVINNPHGFQYSVSYNGSSVTVIIVAVPTVTSVSPTAGPTAGSTSVVITGTGFTGATQVEFGSTAATTFTVDSSTQITATDAAGSPGQVDVTVAVPIGGTSTTSPADHFTYVAPPTANGQSVSTNENTALNGTLTGSASDSNPMTYAVVGGPAHGSLTSLNAATGAFTYVPTTGYYGADSFTFTVSDDISTSAPATVSISVVDNVTPVANGQAISTNENTAISGTLTGSDADSNPLTTYAVVSNPAHGSLTSFNASTGVFTYTPTTGYYGADSFTFTVSDGTNTSAAATVSITVVATAPTVTGVTPASGLAGGGTSVVVTGTNFSGATEVDFGITAATTFTINSSTQITATDAAGSGTVAVTVATASGTSATTSADLFTYAAVTGVKLNEDVSPIVDISSNGAGTVTATTDGNNGFSAGDVVVISGYTGTTGATGYNGTFTIGTVTGDTFTVANATAGLPTLTNNNLGLAVSQNTASSLIGNQRSMVDSVAYTFSAPVTGLTSANFTLTAAATAVGLTTSGSATAATTAPGMTLTSLDGGSIWVVTWSGLSASVGHSIADGVYELTLGNSGRATDTFYRLFANVVGYQSSSAHINSTDSLDFSHSYLLGTGAATYLADCDYNADGLVNSTDSLQLSHRYLSVWTGFTPTI